MTSNTPRKFRFIVTAAIFASLLAMLALPTPSATSDTTTDATGPRHGPEIDNASGSNALGAAIGQRGESLVFVIRTKTAVNLKRLSRFPDFPDRRDPFLCFRILQMDDRTERRLCIGGRNRTAHRAGLVVMGSQGTRRMTPVRIKRPNRERLVVTAQTQDTGITAGEYRWRLVARQGGKACIRGKQLGSCLVHHPAGKQTAALEVQQLVPVGCTPGRTGVVRHGSRSRKAVALTFDDGPGPLTDDFLDLLAEKRVRATFYTLGQQIETYPDRAKRIVAEGHEIANHTWGHESYPNTSNLRSTNSAIRSVTGFRPCTFRPPGGAFDAGVVASAKSAGGMPTVIWDVDTMDWKLPGTESIYQTAVGNAKPGSIILMHDAGGPREQTLAALPRIINTLRSRGYRFKTVAQILGGSIRRGLR